MGRDGSDARCGPGTLADSPSGPLSLQDLRCHRCSTFTAIRALRHEPKGGAASDTAIGHSLVDIGAHTDILSLRAKG